MLHRLFVTSREANSKRRPPTAHRYAARRTKSTVICLVNLEYASINHVLYEGVIEYDNKSGAANAAQERCGNDGNPRNSEAGKHYGKRDGRSER